MQMFQVRSLFTVALIFLTAATSACAQEKPKRMVRGPSVRELVPESPNEKEDGISRVIFAQIFKEGATEYKHVGTSALKNAPPLPTGYTLYKDRVYEVKTQAIITAAFNITVFNVPSIENDQEFKNLAILHLKYDEMSPVDKSWEEVTLFTENADEEIFQYIPKAKYDSLQPDFKSRLIAGVSNHFGIFAVARFQHLQSEPNEAFPKLVVEATSSPQPVRAGEKVTHTITVKNDGNVSASEVTIKESLNGDFDYVSVSSDQGFCKPRASTRVVCYLGALPPGATASMTVVARVNANAMLVKREKEVGNTIEVIFKERPTDFVDSRGQIHIQFNTTILKKQLRL